MNAEQKNFIEVVGAIASTDMKNSGVAASLTICPGNFRKCMGKIRTDKNGQCTFRN